MLNSCVIFFAFCAVDGDLLDEYSTGPDRLALRKSQSKSFMEEAEAQSQNDAVCQ